MAVTFDLTAVHTFITTHMATGHRFEIEAEASLPTIRCWDSAGREILAQSRDEIMLAAEMAEQIDCPVVLHVPHDLSGAAHEIMSDRAGRIQIHTLG